MKNIAYLFVLAGAALWVLEYQIGVLVVGVGLAVYVLGEMRANNRNLRISSRCPIHPERVWTFFMAGLCGVFAAFGVILCALHLLVYSEMPNGAFLAAYLPLWGLQAATFLLVMPSSRYSLPTEVAMLKVSWRGSPSIVSGNFLLAGAVLGGIAGVAAVADDGFATLSQSFVLFLAIGVGVSAALIGNVGDSLLRIARNRRISLGAL